MFRLGKGSLKPNMIFVGYVSQTNQNGCFMKISASVIVRATLNNLSDSAEGHNANLFY